MAQESISFQSDYENQRPLLFTRHNCEFGSRRWYDPVPSKLMEQLVADPTLYTSLLPDKAMVRSLFIDGYLAQPSCRHCDGPPIVHTIKQLEGVEQIDNHHDDFAVFAQACEACFSTICKWPCIRCKGPLIAADAAPQDYIVVEDGGLLAGEYLCKQCATVLSDAPRCYRCYRWAEMTLNNRLSVICFAEEDTNSHICEWCVHTIYGVNKCLSPQCDKLYSDIVSPFAHLCPNCAKVDRNYIN
jgi:hypothetical protein